jgi:hypothetical protein
MITAGSARGIADMQRCQHSQPYVLQSNCRVQALLPVPIGHLGKTIPAGHDVIEPSPSAILCISGPYNEAVL